MSLPDFYRPTIRQTPTIMHEKLTADSFLLRAYWKVPWESNGHVTDDVTRQYDVMVVSRHNL